jgi:hypothetical protein
VRVPGLGTPGELLARFGRAVLWLLIAVLLIRGLADVLEPNRPAAPVAAPAEAPAAWPDEDAKAFAAQFSRAYLTYAPRDPEASADAIRAFAAPELATAIAPEYDERTRAQAVAAATVARSVALDDGRALVTVAVAVEGAPDPLYLTVPVARDDAGGLVVSDLPSFAAAPARATVTEPAGDPLPSAEREQIEPVVSRFLQAYLAGDAAAMEYLVPAGTTITAPAPGHELEGVASLSLASPAKGDERLVLASVRARQVESGAIFSLRYRLLLERGEDRRWYVAAVNTAPPREGG